MQRSNVFDAIRGVAILLVVAFHWMEFPVGWAGVDLFFTLSGFLIGGVLIDNRASPTYFRTFYGRRVFRILPLYAVFLLVASLSVGIGLPVWHYLVFAQNLDWATTGLIGAGMPSITWSLAVEEQFYCILPLMVRFASGPALLRTCVFLICAAPFARFGLNLWIGPAAPYVLLPGRMDSLFAGVLAACLVRRVPGAALADKARTLVLLSVGSLAAFLMLGAVSGFSPTSLAMYMFGYSALAICFGAGLMAASLAKDVSPIPHCA